MDQETAAQKLQVRLLLGGEAAIRDEEDNQTIYAITNWDGKDKSCVAEPAYITMAHYVHKVFETRTKHLRALASSKSDDACAASLAWWNENSKIKALRRAEQKEAARLKADAKARAEEIRRMEMRLLIRPVRSGETTHLESFARLARTPWSSLSKHLSVCSRSPGTCTCRYDMEQYKIVQHMRSASYIITEIAKLSPKNQQRGGKEWAEGLATAIYKASSIGHRQLSSIPKAPTAAEQIQAHTKREHVFFGLEEEHEPLELEQMPDLLQRLEEKWQKLSQTMEQTVNTQWSSRKHAHTNTPTHTDTQKRARLLQDQTTRVKTHTHQERAVTTPAATNQIAPKTSFQRILEQDPAGLSALQMRQRANVAKIQAYMLKEGLL